MLATTEATGFRVLTSSRSTAPVWSGALPEFFHMARRLLGSVLADIRGGHLEEPAFLFGAPGDGWLSADLAAITSRIATDYHLPLRSPFEDTPTVAGGLWSGRELFGRDRDDALAKLRFSDGTLDLPLHVHEHSDRFIVVLAGSGRFWWSQQPLQRFTGDAVASVPVQPGDVLVFTRNLLHTFSAPEEDLVLLSYHSPEIPFDDPRQYTLPATRWTPRMHAIQ